ncbi:adenosine receptor A1-like isoform X1 [Gadus chalcogrammus]|uniref:adenosine receptor A1-like isoform X1 n=1 Tax=Gadus chalcogrammus TaxID=1042646 RepID=UPI0024C3FA39|nr:adenosine receptor A1-like isoform X1 [Gadus chalcogrammus]
MSVDWDPWFASYIAMEVVIAVLSVLGNVLVVWAVILNRSLRDTTFCFIFSLALADIAVGSLAIPLAITISIGLQTTFYSCLVGTCTMLVLTQSSILALLAIAIDRYLRVKIPMRRTSMTRMSVMKSVVHYQGFSSYRWVVTPRRASTAVGLCWLVSFMVGLTPLLGWNKLQHANGTVGSGPEAQMTCTFENIISMDYMVYFNFLGWVLPPLLLMLLIYIEIFYIIHKHLNKKVTASQAGPRRRQDYGKELKLVKSLALVLFLFTVSWLPVHILNCITLFCPKCVEHKKGIRIAILLSHGNSAVNPVVYSFHINKFHTAFRKIWQQYILCRDPVGKLPQKSGQSGWNHAVRRRHNSKDAHEF